MYPSSFKIIFLGVLQILILGILGFGLIKRRFLSEEGLNQLSKLVIRLTLPLFIFCGLIKEFDFLRYSNWWLFPIFSLIITLSGLALGSAFLKLQRFPQGEYKREFLSLITFQNSGYLPLILIATIVPEPERAKMFIYLFLFLLGFNLIIWSFGVYLLTKRSPKNFELGNLFSPPVLATLISLILVFLRINRFIPYDILYPLKMLGDCTLPLAIIVVGGNLALIKKASFNLKAIFLSSFAKLIALPLLFLILIIYLKPTKEIGLLIILESAMPPATSLSLIVRHYGIKDNLISSGIFFGHIASIITIPIFLSLYHIFAI